MGNQTSVIFVSTDNIEYPIDTYINTIAINARSASYPIDRDQHVDNSESVASGSQTNCNKNIKIIC